MYDAAADLVTLAYRMLPANESALPEADGVANSALQAVQSASLAPAGSGQQALPAAVAPGTAVYNATVFMDIVNISRYTSGAADKVGVVSVQPDLYLGDPCAPPCPGHPSTYMQFTSWGRLPSQAGVLKSMGVHACAVYGYYYTGAG